MKISHICRVVLCVPFLLVLTQLMACSTTAPTSPSIATQSSRLDIPQPRNSKQIYAGAGLGLSRLEPDTSEQPGYDVTDKSSLGGQVTLGMDLSRRFSSELHLASLGSAGISPQGDVSYQIGGVSGLLYAGKKRHNYKRRGLTGYGRLGVGMLQNSISDGLEVEKVNSTHLLLGFGAEYNMRSGLGIRGEVVSYDQDANVVQLALIYRFNQRQSRKVVPITNQPPETVPMIPPVTAIAVDPNEDDDGVSGSAGHCPDTAIGVSVSAKGCASFVGLNETVTFNSNSSTLTGTAKSRLDDVANALVQFPAVILEIQAHTDSRGRADYNLALSEQRAASVNRYLISRGVAGARLKARAFGETNPIAPNTTAEGRQQNRRVEVAATQR